MDTLTKGRTGGTILAAFVIGVLAAFAPHLSQNVYRDWGLRYDKWTVNDTLDTAQWHSFRLLSPTDTTPADPTWLDWDSRARDTSKWDPRCDAVAAHFTGKPGYSIARATISALENTEAWAAKDRYSNASGEALSPKKIVVNDYYIVNYPEWAFGTFIHEAQHHEGDMTEEQIRNVGDSLLPVINGYLEDCHRDADEEEDEDEPCGAAADCGGGEQPTTTCTEKEVYVRWTEYVEVSEFVEWAWVGVHDPSSGTEDNPIYELVPVYRTYWKEVQRGEWQTQTVCTTTSS